MQHAFAHFGYCVTCTILIGLVNKFFVDGIVIISIISPVEVFSCPHPFLTRSQFFLVVLCAMILFVNVQNFASFQWFLCFSPESASNASGWSCNCWCRHQCCWKSIWRFSPTAIWHGKCCSGWHIVVIKYSRYICDYPFQNYSAWVNDASFCLCGIRPFQVKAAWHSFKVVHLLKHSLNLFPVTHVVMQSLCFLVSGRFVSSVIR